MTTRYNDIPFVQKNYAPKLIQENFTITDMTTRYNDVPFVQKNYAPKLIQENFTGITEDARRKSALQQVQTHLACLEVVRHHSQENEDQYQKILEKYIYLFYQYHLKRGESLQKAFKLFFMTGKTDGFHAIADCNINDK